MVGEEIFVNASVIGEVFPAENSSNVPEFQLSPDQESAIAGLRTALPGFANSGLFAPRASIIEIEKSSREHINGC